MFNSAQDYLLAQRQRVPDTGEVELVTDQQREDWERAKRELLFIISALMTRVLSGEISTREWQRLMLTQLNAGHTLAFSIGGVGLEQFKDDLAAQMLVGARVAQQRTYLLRFAVVIATALAAGKVLSSTSLLQRAGLYVEAMKASLNAGAVYAKGMPTLPAYPGDGSTRCKVNCKCRWVISQLDKNDYNCYWTLGDAEHCEHCPRRAVVWSPLKIRDGEILPYFSLGLFI